MFRAIVKRDKHGIFGWSIIAVAMIVNAFFWVHMNNRRLEHEQWYRFVNGPMFVHQISPECKETAGCRFVYAQ